MPRLPSLPHRRHVPLDEDIARRLDADIAPEQPADPELLDRVRGRILQEIAALHTTVRSTEQPWVRVAEGVERRVLYTTPSSLTSLMRFQPGARVPGHTHPADEECLVLEGSLRIGADLLLHAGDFHVGMRGVPHPAASTETGAVIFLREGRVEVAGA